MSETKHRVVSTDHRGNESVLTKPANESAMTQAEKDEWHRQRHEYLSKRKDKKS